MTRPSVAGERTCRIIDAAIGTTGTGAASGAAEQLLASLPSEGA